MDPFWHCILKNIAVFLHMRLHLWQKARNMKLGITEGMKARLN